MQAPNVPKYAWWVGALGLIIGLIVIGAKLRAAKLTTVEVIQPKVEQLAEVLALSGQVRGINESSLTPEITGTIRKIEVAEGDKVTKGQRLASLDQNVLKAKLQQAKASVQVARSQLTLVERRPLASQLEEVRSEVMAGRLSAQANLKTAQQKLLEAKNGPRVEQIEQAQATLKEAKLESEQKMREAMRQKSLLASGAVSTQSAEQATTLADRAAEAERNAQAYLYELKNGTRPEVLEQAKAAVQEAEAGLLSAEKAGKAKIQQLLDLPREEDIALAKSQLNQALSTVATLESELKQSEVLAPYDGVVGRILLRIGDTSGPNIPILTFSSFPQLEIRVDADESDRSRLRIGQIAQIHANGYPEEFKAKLRELSPEVDSLRGTLEVKLTPLDPPAWILPGQTVDVNIVLSEEKSQLVIPLTCVILKGDQAQIMTIEKGRVVPHTILISSPTPLGYLVRSGLEQKDLIALVPQSLKKGQKVRANLRTP